MAQIVRVRSKTGTERINISPNTSWVEFKKMVSDVTGVPPESQNFFSDQKNEVSIQGKDDALMGELNLENGTMLFLTYTGEFESPNPKKQLLKDLDVKWDLQKYTKHLDEKGLIFRKQDGAHCTIAKVDSQALQKFHIGAQLFDNQRYRIGLLYGVYTDDGGIQVEVVYEPKQETTSDTFEIQESPLKPITDTLASLFGLELVGWIVFQSSTLKKPPKGTLTSKECMLAVQLQSEALKLNPEKGKAFTTLQVKFTEGAYGVEAFQVTDHGLKLYNNNGFLPPKTNKYVRTKEKIAVVQQGVGRTETTRLNTELLVTVVPIEQTENSMFLTGSSFPIENRDTEPQSMVAVKQHIENPSFKNLLFVNKINDFHLLIFLAEIWDLQTVGNIVEAIKSKNNESLHATQELLQSYISCI